MGNVITEFVLVVQQPYAGFIMNAPGDEALSTLVSRRPAPTVGTVTVYAAEMNVPPGGRIGDWKIEWLGIPPWWKATSSPADPSLRSTMERYEIARPDISLPCHAFLGTVDIVESLPIYDMSATEASSDGRYAVAAPTVISPSGQEHGGLRVLDQQTDPAGTSTLIESLHRDEPYLNVEPGHHAIRFRNPQPYPQPERRWFPFTGRPPLFAPAAGVQT